jgi:hypothetical protein
MGTYTYSSNFGSKDDLLPGNPEKVIKGADFETEFTALQSAVNSKSDTASPTFTGVVTIPTLSLSATQITATGTEINILDGVTATTAEINILDGVTATTAELNKLDGVTATTDEINYLDGVTEDIQTQLNARLSKTGGTMTGDIVMATGNTINFGSNSELQIERTDTASIIRDDGSNNLFLLSNGDAIVLGTDTPSFENSIRANIGGAAELYHDGTKKIETSSTGAKVYGEALVGQVRVESPTVPSAADSTGSAGSIAWDSDYIYVCVATNTWKRVALSTW